MTLTPANLLDVALLLLLLVVALAYRHKGFVGGLVQFGGNLASLLGAGWISQKAAPLLFGTFFASGLENSVADTLSSEGYDLTALVQRYGGFLPQSIQDALLEKLVGLIDTGAPSLAAQVVEQVIEPLFTPIIAIVVFFVALAVCRMAISLLVAILTNLNAIPVVGGANKGLGFLLGLLAGALDAYLALCIVWALMVITGGQIPWLTESVLADSFAYRFFSAANPFMMY